MFTKSDVLNEIISITIERERELIDGSDGALTSNDLPTVQVSMRTLFNRFDSNITTYHLLYEFLDELYAEGNINDVSSTNMSWGRQKCADGNISPSFGFFIELQSDQY